MVKAETTREQGQKYTATPAGTWARERERVNTAGVPREEMNDTFVTLTEFNLMKLSILIPITLIVAHLTSHLSLLPQRQLSSPCERP